MEVGIEKLEEEKEGGKRKPVGIASPTNTAVEGGGNVRIADWSPCMEEEEEEEDVAPVGPRSTKYRPEAPRV